jgi:hypothetical protein
VCVLLSSAIVSQADDLQVIVSPWDDYLSLLLTIRHDSSRELTISQWAL